MKTVGFLHVAAGRGQHVFGSRRAGAPAFAHDVVEENFLGMSGDIVFVEAGGVVQFFTQDGGGGAVDGFQSRP